MAMCTKPTLKRSFRRRCKPTVCRTRSAAGNLAASARLRRLYRPVLALAHALQPQVPNGPRHAAAAPLEGVSGKRRNR